MNRLLLLAPRIATNRLWARAGEVPSFHIAPARTQNARDLITGSVLGTYNSASPAWAVGPDGVLALPAANAPVVEYDPTTGACLGARIWGVVTNLWLQSENLVTTWLNARSSSSSNVATAPNNTLTADKLIEDTTASNSHYFYQGAAVTSGITYTASWFVKAAGRQNVSIQFFGTNGAFALGTAYFNLSSGTVADALTVNAASIIALNDGWYRISATKTAIATVNGNIGLFLGDATGNQSYTGNGTSGVFVWGAQLQTGSTLGPYVPTTTTAASNTADVWDITSLTAGINNLKTLYFRGRTSASGTRGIASLNDNTANNRVELSTSGTTAKATAVTSAATVADLSGGTIAANTTFRLAVRLDTDSYALSLNGGAVVTDTSGARALVDRLFIGRDQAGNYMNGYIEEMAGWTKPCADGQLSALAAS